VAALPHPDGLPRAGTGLLVVVPTYNELATLPLLVDQVRRAVPGAHLLVVDDGSPDGTGRVADDLARDTNAVHVLHRPGKLGLGSAYRAGFGWGLWRNYPLYAAIDADLSHDPQVLPELLAALESADVVIGSRYVPGGAVGSWSIPRRLLSRSANRYVRALTGLPLRDATSGYRVVRREVLEVIDVERLRSDGYAFQIESALRAHRSGFRVAEVPIRFEERRAGRSKLSRRVMAEAAWRVPVWAVSGRRRAPTPHPESIVTGTATA
jgi:dolichol-phosphate mannosyltransferase